MAQPASIINDLLEEILSPTITEFRLHQIRRILERRVARDSDDHAALAALGLVHENLHQPDQAAHYYEIVAQLRPDDAMALSNHATGVVATQGVEAALECVLAAMDRSDALASHPVTLETLASLLVSMGYRESARDALQEALVHLNPVHFRDGRSWSLIHVRLAIVAFGLAELKTAVELSARHLAIEAGVELGTSDAAQFVEQFDWESHRHALPRAWFLQLLQLLRVDRAEPGTAGERTIERDPGLDLFNTTSAHRKRANLVTWSQSSG